MIEKRNNGQAVFEVFSFSPDGAIMIDKNLIIREINHSLLDLLGFSHDELIGKSFIDLSTYINLTHLHIEPFFNGELTSFQTELELKHKKGDMFWASLSVYPVLVENRSPSFVIIQVKDITKIKGQLLRISKFESFIDNNLDSILIFNEHGNLVRLNKAVEQMFGWTSNELIGVNISDIPWIPNDKKQEAKEARGAVLKRNLRFETLRIKKDGTVFPVLLTGFPFKKDEKSNPSGWGIILKDIKERKETEKLALRTEKLSLAGQLAAGIAHEIRKFGIL